MSRGAVPAAAIAVSLLVAACQQQPDPAPAPSPTATATPTPVASAAPEPGLDRFLGKYPSDPVAGSRFVTDPKVVAAIRASGAEARVQELILGGAGPQTPIRKVAGKIVSWGCEQHNCSAHNWTVALLPDGTGGEVCYFNEDEIAADGPRAATWYADGKRSARTDPCPSGE